MRNSFFKSLLLVLVLFCFGFVSAQQTVTGTVTDANNFGLPGVNVIIQGSSTGTTTDFDGNYTLANVPSDGVLVFSFVGFTTKAVSVEGKSTLNVVLAEDVSQLSEVVVVGYGTQSRAEVTGAISSIDSEAITSVPVATADQALQGRAAGVTVINSGSPGADPVVRIRGLGTPNDNTPLYVIDGVIASGLGNLNANDIETMTVLKDASTTAIYGSQGANGVVMVTTKQGRSGKVQISLDAYTGVQSTNARYDLLNTAQYLQYASDNGVSPTRANIPNTTTDWQDALFQSGIMQNYNLSVSGGGENSNFRISGGYMDQEGIIVETGFKRYSFRANSNFTSGKFKIGESLSIAFNNQNPENASGGRSLIEHAIKSAPYLSVYNTENPGGFQGPNTSVDGQDAENPIRVQTLGEAVNNETIILGSIFGEYEIIEGLKYKSQFGLEYSTFNDNRFIPSYDDDSVGSTNSFGYAQITKNSGVGKTLIFTNSLNYNTTISEMHNFDVLVLAEKYENNYDGLNITSQNPITDEVNQLSNEQSNISPTANEVQRIGYLGRINYDYDGKYLLAVSLRRDASSRFGSNERWGWFPSVAAGWNIAKESFMGDSAFSNLKLRGSWGIVGNDKIGNYLYSATLTSNFGYPIAGANAVGTTANGLPNADLKWEETSMTNIGLDFGILNEKITGSLEYYNNTSDDLLIAVPLPVSLGDNRGTLTQNIGKVENKGFELNLGYNDYDGDFTWSASLNLGTSTNEVLALGVGEITGATFEAQQISRIAVGEALYHFYGYKTDGIYQTQAEVDADFTAPGANATGAVQPGDIRFLDLNNDGDINAADKTVIGNPYPDVTYGLNLNAGYKNFDFSVFINGVSGNDIFNTNIWDLEGMTSLFNASTAVLDSWTPSNTDTNIPRATFGDARNLLLSDRYVEDGSFTRLKNLTVGYTFNDNANLAKYFSKLRVYVSGQNLITITDYSGLDPEIGNSTVINNTRYEVGIDRGNYPQPISFLVGLQVTF